MLSSTHRSSIVVVPRAGRLTAASAGAMGDRVAVACRRRLADRPWLPAQSALARAGPSNRSRYSVVLAVSHRRRSQSGYQQRAPHRHGHAYWSLEESWALAGLQIFGVPPFGSPVRAPSWPVAIDGPDT